MKLPEHVQHIKSVTHNAFDNLFARLGIRAKELVGEDLIPDYQLSKRAKILELIDNHKEEKDDYAEARERALEELTFTLFNRIAAVKVMEAKTLFPEIITKRPENGDRSFQHKAWLEQNHNMRSEELEGLREFIMHAFNTLGEELALYQKSYPYALLPNTIDLNEIIEAFNAVEKDNDIDDRIWASDDILGWLYESYNNDKKVAFKEDGGKTEYDKVSLQSQVYTPRWVVEFLVNNSLGKLYLEMYPTSDIKNRIKIANAPQKQLREPKPMHEVTLIDPAPGSGNFLLYAFDLFYEQYVDQIEFFGADYDEEDIPKLIIENNLFGIDLDDRAVQLAQLGLYIKAKSKNRNTSVPSFHVVSSAFYLPDFETVRPLFEDGGALESGVTDLLKEIWDDLQNAHKFGSLLKIEDRVKRRLKKFQEEPMDLFVQEEVTKYGTFEEKFFPRIRKAVQEHANGNTTAFVKEKTLDALTYLEILTQKYDVAVANPPYTDSGDFGSELKKFVGDNYKEPYKFHSNLYATFIKRCSELSSETGKLALIHPMTFMFIKSFEDVRKYILGHTHISIFVEYGLSNLFGAVMADPAFYVLEKGMKETNDSIFIRLDPYTRTPQEKFKKEYCLTALENIVKGEDDKHIYHLPQSKLQLIKGWPFIYWISDGFREKFDGSLIGDIGYPTLGLKTAKNEKYLRFWWEVTDSYPDPLKSINNKWNSYAKGGEFNRWYGNNWLLINWENDGEEVKNQKNSQMIEKGYDFKEGVCVSTRSVKGVSARYLSETQLFDMASSSIISNSKEYTIEILSFSNSKLFNYTLNCLNPTVNKQPEDIRRVPYSRAKLNIGLTKFLGSALKSISEIIEKHSFISPDYEGSIINPNKTDLSRCIEDYIENLVIYEIIEITAQWLLDQEYFKAFELTESDKESVLDYEGISPFTFSVEQSVRDNFVVKLNELSIDQELKKLLIKEFENINTIEEEIKTEKVQLDKLFKKNTNVIDLSNTNSINPLYVWALLKSSDVKLNHIYEEATLEFVSSLLLEILLEDEDGMIPLVRNAGEEVLIDRLERKMREKGFSTAQISQLDGLLGRPLNEYLQDHFFKELSDHLNLFMYLPKTPFIWHLSSGPDKGFECYLVIYKWSRDNLLSLKSVYIEKRERALKNRLTDLGDRSDAASQNERATIQKQLEEIDEFKEKIDDLIASGYDPILDDGVGKNIAPLQKRGMIPYDVLNKSQLKKYLNADW